MANFKGTIEVSGWEDVKKSALVTIHKKYMGAEITSDWKKKILLSRHSPIRELKIAVYYEELPRWIADQLVRHTIGVNNYMGTMRSDRGGKDRDKQKMSDTTEFYQVYNGESFIKMASTRLCVGCVSKETRECVEALVEGLREIEPEVALMCVPPCVANFGCKEVGFGGCPHFRDFFQYTVDMFKGSKFIDVGNIMDRYALYIEFKEQSNV